MQRTIISLEPEYREWLADQAQREHVPQTEVVRRALRLYREKSESQAPQSFEELARLTCGLQIGRAHV